MYELLKLEIFKGHLPQSSEKSFFKSQIHYSYSRQFENINV